MGGGWGRFCYITDTASNGLRTLVHLLAAAWFLLRSLGHTDSSGPNLSKESASKAEWHLSMARGMLSLSVPTTSASLGAQQAELGVLHHKCDMRVEYSASKAGEACSCHSVLIESPCAPRHWHTFASTEAQRGFSRCRPCQSRISCAQFPSHRPTKAASLHDCSA